MRPTRTSPTMKRPLPLILFLSSLLVGTSLGCSLRYDADELPRKTDATDDGGDDDADASDVDPGDASGVDPADASPDQPDAAPEPDATVTPGPCGDVGEMCCEDSPSCGFGDPFIECDEDTSMCEECGEQNGPCCETGDECQDLALFGCGLDGICSLLL